MIVSDGYYIEQYTKQNKIVISLPQTFNTMQNTVTPFDNRKEELSEEDLAMILSIVKSLYQTK